MPTDAEVQEFLDYKAMKALRNKPIIVSRPTPTQPDDPEYRYEYKEFPKMKYHPDSKHPKAAKQDRAMNPNWDKSMPVTGDNVQFLPGLTYGQVVVKNAEEEKALGDGWVDSVNDFGKKRNKEVAA